MGAPADLRNPQALDASQGFPAKAGRDQVAFSEIAALFHRVEIEAVPAQESCEFPTIPDPPAKGFPGDAEGGVHDRRRSPESPAALGCSWFDRRPGIIP